nr:epoxide hydrolase a [Quercus suber]
MTSLNLKPLPLPDNVVSKYVDCTSSCGLNFHTIQAGKRGNPLVLFTHGYPELAYSWRKILPEIAALGYYCVAPDQRGYGRTTGWANVSYEETKLDDYTFTNLVRDLVCLTYRLGYNEAKCIVGHDFGAVSSAMAALMRPDVFKATVQMSHPHHAPPLPPLGDKPAASKPDIQAELSKLNPPRKHYKWYNSTAAAADEWNNPPQGLKSFLRGYFHLKSANWTPNRPEPLKEWSAEALASMPEYYIMHKDRTMPETVTVNMDSSKADYKATESWLSPEELDVYCAEWGRTGFTAALSWYRAQTSSTPQSAKDMLLFAGRRLEVPCVFISGKSDWGNYQQPGALQSYDDPKTVKEGYNNGVYLVDGAGHWIQQEQADAVVQHLTHFLAKL